MGWRKILRRTIGIIIGAFVGSLLGLAAVIIGYFTKIPIPPLVIPLGAVLGGILGGIIADVTGRGREEERRRREEEERRRKEEERRRREEEERRRKEEERRQKEEEERKKEEKKPKYLANSNTLEIHNLSKTTPSCRIHLMKEKNKVYFYSFDEVMKAIKEQGYNGCRWCMEEYDTG